MPKSPPPLDDEIRALYHGPLGEFTPARQALAKRLKKEGDPRQGEVGALRKPSLSAWAVNRLFAREPLSVDGCSVVPRDFFIEVVTPHLRGNHAHDLVALRVEVSGTKDGLPRMVRWDVLDRYDAEHGMTAMMRTTGYSLAITTLMQMDGRIRARGVHTPDEAVPVGPYVSELAARGIEITRSDH